MIYDIQLYTIHYTCTVHVHVFFAIGTKHQFFWVNIHVHVYNASLVCYVCVYIQHDCVHLHDKTSVCLLHSFFLLQKLSVCKLYTCTVHVYIVGMSSLRDHY